MTSICVGFTFLTFITKIVAQIEFCKFKKLYFLVAFAYLFISVLWIYCFDVQRNFSQRKKKQLPIAT